MITSERLDAEKMEIQMKGRIAELEKANQALRAELLDRSYSEEALRKSEEKYRMLFNSIGEGFFLIEVIFNSKGKPVNYRIFEANQSQEKVTGLRDIEGKQIRKLFAEIKDDFVKSFGQVALTGNSVRFESKVESVARWFDIYASRIGDEYSRKVAVLFKDITERKKAEKNLKEACSVLEEKVKERTAELEKAYDLLKESERSLAEAQKMAHIGNWSRNIANGEVHWSDETYRIFGFKPQEFGVTYNEFLSQVHPEDQDFLIEASKQALKGKLSSIDYRIIRSNGEERIVHEEAKVVFDEKNIPIQIRGTIQDITESKKAEQELIRVKEELTQRATDKYLMLFNSIDEGYALCEVIYDADGKASDVRYLEVNSAFGKLSGMEDLKDKTMRQLVSDIESIWIENAAKVVETGEAFHFEGYLESLGCWADLRFLRIGDEISHTIAIIFNNIAENRLAEHKIYRYN
ncbi:MAG: hypothetical protein QG610_957, partial [Euryarchaeota archaeon]|nr:hypothetical protein [Euryarchaeota archaeon]